MPAHHGHGHGHGHSSSISSPQAAALPNHQLGELIGRGAFGAVYRALNWQTGETVAVKQVALGNIPTSELPEIMSEIDLLKNLNHPNVVQYRGFVKTVDFLWIVLEYCENGSLTAICKKFGKFPESLCQIYICQVLEGLLYLHDQGVIHRDIKGSNILATKEGSIKLADFGVATRVGGHDRSVVGSPYWMAPEVVEQSGATTASDIWSVGCVVIELLEGQPPYHELDPMPALFRIVNDDCPPLPDSASPVVRDFLLQCFQKDSNLRISARKLLRHPWMVSARKQLDQTKQRLLASASSSNLNLAAVSRRNISAYDETVQKVQAWNEALDKQQPTPLSQPLSARVPASVRRSNDVVSALQQASNVNKQTNTTEADRELLGQASKAPARGERLTVSRHTGALIKSHTPSQQSEEKENDNWDNDFPDVISDVKLASSDSKDEDSSTMCHERAVDNSDTIRPGSFSPATAFPAKKALQPVLEDWSDLVDDDEVKPFTGRMNHLRKSSNDATKRILHPRDLSGGTQRKVNNITTARSATVRSPQPLQSASRPTSTPSDIANPANTPAKLAIARIDDPEQEDYSDSFDDKAISRGPSRKLELTKKLSSRSWLGDDDMDEDDPFAEVEQTLDQAEGDDSLEANVQRDKLARVCSFITDLLDGMNAEADELAIRDGCIYLIDILDQMPEAKVHLVKAHGLLTIVESLQVVRSREVMSLELRIVNILVADDPDRLEKICLIGGCPVIMKFSHSRYSRDIRLEAALFIGAMCRTSLLTLQMFVSCRGLRTLIDMMDENYRDQKDLVWMSVDGICRVFDMQGTTPRNDFCRMFAKEGLLDPLSTALLAVAEDNDDLAQSALHKIAHILLLFSQSDLKVKMDLAQRPIMLRLVRSMATLPQELLPTLLKTIKNISMAPAALDVLQNANAIETLVKTMIRHIDITEVCNPVVNTLYNLCRLSKSRQEEAALAGAVPALLKLVHNNSPLKQFALPIICDFAHTSKTCRKALWQHKVFNLYISLLRDPFWNLSALEAVLAWLQDETSRIEDALLEETSLQALLRAFSEAKAATFENILEPLLKILRLSGNLCNKLAQQPILFIRLVERMSSHPKAVVRLNLLKLVKTLFEAAQDPAKVCKQANVVSTINRLAEDDPSLLVKDLAKGLLQEFTDADKKGKSRRLLGGLASSPSLPGTSMNKLSRTWSDSAMSQILANSSTSSPRYKLKSRPNSPSLQGQDQVESLPSTRLSPSASSSASKGQALPSRRISVRSKPSPSPNPSAT